MATENSVRLHTDAIKFNAWESALNLIVCNSLVFVISDKLVVTKCSASPDSVKVYSSHYSNYGSPLQTKANAY